MQRLLRVESSGGEIVKWLYDHYKIQVQFQGKNARELDVPDNLTKTDAAVIIGELLLMFG